MNTEHASRTAQIDWAAALSKRHGSTGPQARRIMRLTGAFRRQMARDGVVASTLISEINSAVPRGAVLTFGSTGPLIDGEEVP